MNTPCIYTAFEVWHGPSGNMIAYFDSATAALEELNGWVVHNGEAVLDDLYMHLCLWSPVLTDEESLELDDDESAGPGMAIIELLVILSMAEQPRSFRSYQIS